jgi:hypothetical protein
LQVVQAVVVQLAVAEEQVDIELQLVFLLMLLQAIQLL